MGLLSQTDGKEKLSLWYVSDPPRATRLNTQYFNLSLTFGDCYRMKMDEDGDFIAVSTFQLEETKFYFFSKKTLDLHWRRNWPRNEIENIAYGNGVLL